MLKVVTLQTILIFLILFTSSVLCAQRVDRNASTSVGKYCTAPQFSLSYSIGESVVFTGSSTSFVLTQGFEQNDLEVFTGIKNGNPEIQISSYPNPVYDRLNIYFKKEILSPRLTIEVYDLLGKRQDIVNTPVFLNHSCSIEFSSYKNGIYFINLISPADDMNEVLKIIKE